MNIRTLCSQMSIVFINILYKSKQHTIRATPVTGAGLNTYSPHLLKNSSPTLTNKSPFGWMVPHSFLFGPSLENVNTISYQMSNSYLGQWCVYQGDTGGSTTGSFQQYFEKYVNQLKKTSDFFFKKLSFLPKKPTSTSCSLNSSKYLPWNFTVLQYQDMESCHPAFLTFKQISFMEVDYLATRQYCKYSIMESNCPAFL